MISNLQFGINVTFFGKTDTNAFSLNGQENGSKGILNG